MGIAQLIALIHQPPNTHRIMNTTPYAPVVALKQLDTNYGSNMLEAIWNNLSTMQNAKDLTLKIAFLTLLRHSQHIARLKGFASNEITSLCLACIATLSRQFFLTPPFNVNKSDDEFKPTNQYAQLPDSWKILLWQAAQLKALKLESLDPTICNQMERWLLEQLSSSPLIDCSYDAARKTRERLKKHFRNGYDEVVCEIHSLLKNRCAIVIDWISGNETVNTCPTELRVHLKRLVDECGPSELNTPANFIADVEHYGVYRKKTEDHKSFFNNLAALANKEREEKIEQSWTRIYHRIAKLAETVSATYATLLTPLNETESYQTVLKVRVSHNVDLPKDESALLIPCTEGIVGRAFRTKRHQLVPDVKFDADYIERIPDTSSELALPLLDPHSGECLGIINLESAVPDWFTTIHALLATSRVREMVPDVLVYVALLKSSDQIISWHYRLPSWSLDGAASRCCDYIKSALHNAYGIKVSPIIWESDGEKGVFWVRGTSGYDYEYAVGKGLPGKSFMGKVFKMAEPLICSLEEAIAQGFVRGDKAKILGVKWVAAVPIPDPSNLSEPWGVFSIYGYRAQESVDKELLAKLASQIGGSLRFWENLLPSVAFAYALMKMGRIAERGKVNSESCRDILKEVFNAQGVSVFMRVDNRLVCQATTGLQDSMGKTVTNLDEAAYQLGGSTRGATTFLAGNPGTTIRKIDATNDEEVVAAQSLRSLVKFEQRFLETGPSGGLEQRRFLGLAVSDFATSASDSFGLTVVRIIRRSGSRPFRQSDCHTLKVVMSAIGPLLEVGPVFPRESAFSRVDIGSVALLQAEMAAFSQCDGISVFENYSKGIRLLLSVGKPPSTARYEADSHYVVADKSLQAAALHLGNPNARICTLKSGSKLRVVYPIFVRVGDRISHLLIEVGYSPDGKVDSRECMMHCIEVGHRLNVMLGLHSVLAEDPNRTKQFFAIGPLTEVIHRSNISVSAKDCWTQYNEMDGSVGVKNITLGSVLLGDSGPNYDLWKVLLSLRHSLSALKFSFSESSLTRDENDWQIWDVDVQLYGNMLPANMGQN